MQVIKEFPTVDKLHDHVEVHLVMEGVFELDDKWVVEHSQKFSFRAYTLHLVVLAHLLLVYHLHREVAMIMPVKDEIDSTECALADNFQQLKIVSGRRVFDDLRRLT